MKKTILITGAGSGIGRDSACALSLRGHRVIAATQTAQQAQQLQKYSADKKCVLEIIVLNITSPSDREKLHAYDLDVLINNAAIGETGSLSEIPMERVRNNFEVNVFSTLELTQLALKHMMKKKSGSVLFVSSLAGRAPAAFLNPYSMTKFALSGGAAALREELHRVAPHVHISIIEPGAYATGFNQSMIAKKFEWMDEHSYFHSMRETLRTQELKRFSMLEQKTTHSIVAKIVKASESSKPRLRYVAPWYQGFAVFLLRMWEYKKTLLH